MSRALHIANLHGYAGFTGVPARAHLTPGTLVFLQSAR
jgi:hypothetical protein